ncbi:MAG: sulfatase-like hydrolase/transferase [Sedimentisphaeraceae bacterium JB056]
MGSSFLPNRRDFLRFSGAAVAGFYLGGCGSDRINAASSTKRPNVVLITGDDLGIQVGCYGDKTVKTPNIDKLAASGVMFKTAWVSQASCSPSRSSIYTGLYPHQNGQIGLCHRGYSMNRTYPTITSILKDAGYRTAVIGKYHIEPKKACPWDEQYSDFTTYFEQRDVKTAADVGEDFMNRSGDEPFFLMLNYIDPHTPLYDQRKGLPAEPYTADNVESLELFGFDTPEIREQTAGYYNCVNRLDTGLGMLMDKLKATGNYENTLVIFVGDHGPPFTRSKTTCYDIGLRIPFIVSCPGVVSEGLVSDQMVSTTDILPTILDITGIDLPEPVTGRSLKAEVQGKDVELRQYMFGEHHTHQQFSWFPRRSVRDQRYQLIVNLLENRENPIKGVDGCVAWKASRKEGVPPQVKAAYDRYNKPPHLELYDLEKDPYCFVNLADSPEYEATKERLLAALNQWREKTADPYLDADYRTKMTEKHDQMYREYMKSKK